HSIDAIVATDIDGNICSWNHGAELMFGYKPKEIIGKRFGALLLIKTRKSKKMQKISQEFHEKGYLKNFVVDAITKEGRPIIVDITRRGIRDDDGKELGSSSIIRDITEIRRVERRMVSQEKMLALGELAASLAHEIKNPLNSMVINMEVLKGHFSDLPEG